MAARGLSVCAGGGAGPAWDAETKAMGFPPSERRRRMIENIAVLRHLWTTDHAPFEGELVRFQDISLQPKPIQSPCPIWLTTNAGRLGNAQGTDRQSGTGQAGGSSFAPRRVGRLADGCMTHSVTPEGFDASLSVVLEVGREAGRDMAGFDNVLCHHIDIGANPDAVLADAKRYLDGYYGANYTVERLRAWGVYGPADHCVQQISRFAGSGCNRITFRLATTGDAMEQFRRLTQDVLPFVAG